jgi:hypothetical protein
LRGAPRGGAVSRRRDGSAAVQTVITAVAAIDAIVAGIAAAINTAITTSFSATAIDPDIRGAPR